LWNLNPLAANALKFRSRTRFWTLEGAFAVWTEKMNHGEFQAKEKGAPKPKPLLEPQRRGTRNSLAPDAPLSGSEPWQDCLRVFLSQKLRSLFSRKQ
jgi:hypothetical protein